MLKQLGMISAFVFMSAGMASAQSDTVAVLMGATIIDGKGGSIENGIVVVEGDRIICVGGDDECDVPDNAQQRNLSGHFITPGLVDAHVHFGQTGWIDGRPDGIEAVDIYPYDQTVAYQQANPGRWHNTYLCSGITAVYDVGGQAWTVTGDHATDTDRADRVHVRAAGPLITHASARNRFFQRGDATDPLFLPMDSDEQVREEVAYLQEIGAAAVKVWFLAPNPERRAELDERLMLVGQLAQEAGLPLIVHATGLREAKVALRAGAKMLVHSVEDRPVDQEFLDLLLRNKAVYAPTLVVGSGWTRAVASVFFEKAVTVDDPNQCVDAEIMDRITHPERLKEAMGDGASATAMMARLERVGRTQALMAANLLAVFNAGGHVVTATDAGNPLTVHGPSIYWEMEAMQQAGLSANDIIVASTRKGAEAMGLESEIGTLEAGKMADLIVLADDPRADIAHFRTLTHVMRKGVLHDQDDLKVRN